MRALEIQKGQQGIYDYIMTSIIAVTPTVGCR